MREVRIITMTEQQLEELLDKKIEQISTVLEAKSKHSDTADILVDIASLKANLGWKDGKARRLVREGKIKPKFTGNGKTMFFNLTKCRELHEAERKR